MPGSKPIKSAAWAWFRAELVRLLGADQAAALWAELARRRKDESTERRRKGARSDIAYYEELLAERRRQGRATKRIEGIIERRRALMEQE
jgi:hypothetical protein